MYTRLDVFLQDSIVSLSVLTHKHNIMCNVRVIKAYIVTQIHYEQSCMCFVNELFNKCTFWCLLNFSLVRHVAELAEQFNLCILLHIMFSMLLFSLHEFHYLMMQFKWLYMHVRNVRNNDCKRLHSYVCTFIYLMFEDESMLVYPRLQMNYQP